MRISNKHQLIDKIPLIMSKRDINLLFGKHIKKIKMTFQVN